MKRKLIFLVWTIAWSAGLTLGVLELGVRSGLIRHSFQMWEVVYQLDPATLYGIKPRSHPDIGPFGNRRTGRAGPAHPTRRLLFLGDSFVYGTNVKREETAPAALERLLGPDWEVLNLGVAGYGPDQSLAQLQAFGLALKPRAVVLMLFPSNDFNDLYKNQLFTAAPDGTLQRNPHNALASRMPRLRSALIWDLVLHQWAGCPSRYVDIYDSFFHDHYDYGLIKEPDSQASQYKRAVMRGVLKTFRDTLRQREIPFLVIIVPSYEAMVTPATFDAQGVPPDRHLVNEDAAATLCREEGIAALNLYPELLPLPDRAAWYDPADHHLSPAGYQAVAERVRQALRQQGVAP